MDEARDKKNEEARDKKNKEARDKKNKEARDKKNEEYREEAIKGMMKDLGWTRQMVEAQFYHHG